MPRSPTRSEAARRVPTPDEGYCSETADETHCVHWWDGDEPCCACGHNGGAAEPESEKPKPRARAGSKKR